MIVLCTQNAAQQIQILTKNKTREVTNDIGDNEAN